MNPGGKCAAQTRFKAGAGIPAEKITHSPEARIDPERLGAEQKRIFFFLLLLLWTVSEHTETFDFFSPFFYADRLHRLIVRI